MSNNPAATAACWSSLARPRCRLINMLIKLYIKLLNMILIFLYK